MLPRETLQLIEKSVFEACAFRAGSARGNVDKGIHLPVKSVEIDVTEAIARGNHERAAPDTFYPEFERSRDRFNLIRQAVIENREVDLTLFENDSKTAENYVLAVLASQMKIDCPVRAQAWRYLKRLDPTFYDHLHYRERYLKETRSDLLRPLALL